MTSLTSKFLENPDPVGIDSDEGSILLWEGTLVRSCGCNSPESECKFCWTGEEVWARLRTRAGWSTGWSNLVLEELEADGRWWSMREDRVDPGAWLRVFVNVCVENKLAATDRAKTSPAGGSFYPRAVEE